MTEVVAIVGARDADEATLNAVWDFVRELPGDTFVISGGAAGVDRHAIAAARERGLPCAVLTPVTGDLALARAGVQARQPRDSYLFRNTLIAIACTRMQAYVRGSRGGTRDAVRQAKRFKRPVKTSDE